MNSVRASGDLSASGDSTARGVLRGSHGSADECRSGTRSGRLRRGLAWAAACLLLSSVLAVPAFAKSEPLSEKTRVSGFDLAVLRPLGVIRLAVGSVLYAPVILINSVGQVSLAGFDAMGVGEGAEWQSYSDITELFILEPFNYIVTRPLGEDIAG